MYKNRLKNTYVIKFFVDILIGHLMLNATV